MVHPPGTDERGRPTRSAAGEGEISELDRVLEGIGPERSRRILYCLAESNVETIDALVEDVVEREVGLPARMTSTERRGLIRKDLVHTHLPRLADLGIVEYDPDEGTVDYGNPPPRLDEFLAVCRTMEAKSEQQRE